MNKRIIALGMWGWRPGVCGVLSVLPELISYSTYLSPPLTHDEVLRLNHFLPGYWFHLISNYRNINSKEGIHCIIMSSIHKKHKTKEILPQSDPDLYWWVRRRVRPDSELLTCIAFTSFLQTALQRAYNKNPLLWFTAPSILEKPGMMTVIPVVLLCHQPGPSPTSYFPSRSCGSYSEVPPKFFFSKH